MIFSANYSNFKIFKKNEQIGIDLLTKEFCVPGSTNVWDSLPEALGQIAAIDLYDSDDQLSWDGFLWYEFYGDGLKCWKALAPVIENGGNIEIEDDELDIVVYSFSYGDWNVKLIED